MNYKSPSITTDPNTVQNLRTLTDLIMRIELTRAILLPRPSDFLRNSTIHFCMFLYLVVCSLRVTVSSLCRLQAVSKTHAPIYSCLTIIVKWDEIVRPRDRHSSETVILRKHIPKYKNMRKLVVEVLRRSESRGDEISRVKISRDKISRTQSHH